MTIVLEETVYPSRTQLVGQDAFVLGGTQRLRIKILPDDVDILNVPVPNNKQWNVTVTVSIEEVSVQ
jgi:hypothetical protein